LICVVHPDRVAGINPKEQNAQYFDVWFDAVPPTWHGYLSTVTPSERPETD
jgi:hypothetical protein